ncbi:MAG: T9SS type A sorting domain-containing protein [Weeksellaceae bacterium]|nr:T9SS type A sorting domain-containing protein [Bacteroidota bacterium]MCG2781453.1 T9SS type A sorting domain-containing protein [Weeksellaceae bacterium]
MKKKLFSLAMLSVVVFTFAQQDFYALTGKSVPNIVFSDFRVLDVERGISGELIFGTEFTPKVFSQIFNKNVTEEKTGFNHSQTAAMASLAYDELNGKLIYIPMFSSNVYVLDQKSRDITLIESNVIKSKSCDIGSHITRMTGGYDGNIYAMSNSGSQFLQISRQNGKYVVADLGSVKDDSSNAENSLLAMNKGFGGDMIADADNNFYIFSASGNVFKMSSQFLTAKFIGKISGLPENYSLNGAAVNSKGNVVVASAKGEGMYELNLGDLQAKPLAGNLNIHIYDLASKYFLNDKLPSVTNALADVYPTKVEEDFIHVKVEDQKISGNVSVEIYDFAGIKVLQKTLSSIEKNSTQKVELNNLKSGVYIVSVLDSNKKIILNKKIAVNK